MPRLNIHRQQSLEPARMEHALKKLREKGFVDSITMTNDNTKIEILYNKEKITLFVYSGWHSGKGIKDGRGLDNLLKQL